MIEELADDAVTMIGGGDGEGLNILDDFRRWIDTWKEPRIDGVPSGEENLI